MDDALPRILPEAKSAGTVNFGQSLTTNHEDLTPPRGALSFVTFLWASKEKFKHLQRKVFQDADKNSNAMEVTI